MDNNYILMAVFGILSLYFFSSTSIFKSLYRKVNEEKNILQAKYDDLEAIIAKYEQQMKTSLQMTDDVNDKLKKTREELQESKVAIADLRYKNQQLQAKNDELHAQVHAIM